MRTVLVPIRPRPSTSLEARTAEALARLEAEVEELVDSWRPAPRPEPIRFVPIEEPDPPRPALFAPIARRPGRKPTRPRPRLPAWAAERPLPPALRMVWRLRSRGVRPGVIAKALGVSPAAVSVAWTRALERSVARRQAALGEAGRGVERDP